jgi:hypothetical protein
MLLLENEIMCWSWTQLNATRAEEMPMRKVPLALASELPTSQAQQGPCLDPKFGMQNLHSKYPVIL